MTYPSQLKVITQVLVLVLLFVLVRPSNSYAQMETRGKVFVGTTVKQLYGGGDSVKLFISTDKISRIRLHLYANSTTRNYVVPADTIFEIQVDRKLLECALYNQKQTRGFLLTSDQDISLYLLSDLPKTLDATVVYPSKSIPLSPDYRLLTYSTNNGASEEVAIVSHNDSVEIELKTSYTWASKLRDTIERITLNKGECYLKASRRSGTYISGGHVRVLSPGKKVSVFAGNTCTFVPKSCAFCDMLMEQVPPDNSLGKSFLIPPFKNQTKGYLVRITPLNDGTIIFRDGLNVGTFDKGEVYEYDVTSDRAMCVKTTKPVLVAQLMKGQDCNGLGEGDPSLVYINPNAQLVRRARVITTDTRYIAKHYLSIVIPKSGLKSLYIDGKLVPTSLLHATNCNNYYWYSEPIGKGSHLIENREGFISYVYGTGWHESYLYTAGSSLRNLSMDIKYTVYPSCDSTVLVKFEATDTTAKKYRWFYDGKQGKDSLAHDFHTYKKGGVYKVKMAYLIDNSSFFDTSYAEVVIMPNPVNDLIDEDTIIACVDSVYRVEVPYSPLFSYKWSNGETTHYTDLRKSQTISLEVIIKDTDCKLYDTAVIQFNDKVLADFSFFAPEYCPGFTLQLRDSSHLNKAKDSIVQHRWKVDFDYFSSKKNDSIPNLVANNYEVELWVKSKQGCIDSISKEIAIGSKPIVEFKITPLDSCLNENLFDLRNESYTLFGVLDTFQWRFSDGDTLMGSRVQKSFKQVGTHYIELFTRTKGGCAGTLTDSVFVSPSPEARPHLLDSVLCLKNNQFIFENAFNDSILTYYHWNWGDGSTNTSLGYSEKSYADTGTYIVELIAEHDQTRCKDTAHRSVQVIQMDFSTRISFDSSETCLSQNYFRLNPNAKFPSGTNPTFSWDFGDDSLSSSRSPLHRYSKDGRYEIQLIMDVGAGCKDTSSKFVTIHPVDPASFVAVDSFNCDGNGFFKFKHPGLAHNTYAYWSVNGKRMKSGYLDSFFHRFDTMGNYVVRLITETDLFACTDTFDYEVSIVPRIKSKIRVLDSVTCLQQNRFLIENASDIQIKNLVKSRWMVDGRYLLSAGDSIEVRFDTEGFHWVKLIVGSNGTCPDTSEIRLKVDPEFKSTVAINDPIQCLHTNRFIVNSAFQNDSVAQLLWSDGNGNISNQQNDTFQYSDAGEYLIRLWVESKNGCRDTIRQTVQVLSHFTGAIHINDSLQCIDEQNFRMEHNPVSFQDSILDYSWNIHDQFFGSGPVASNVQFQDTGSKTITLITETHSGCKDTLKSVLYVYPELRIDFTADTTCLGDRNEFISELNSGHEIEEYRWYTADIAIKNEKAFSYRYNDTGYYDVSLFVRDVNGCTDSLSKAKIAGVIPKPVSAFSFEEGDEFLGEFPISLKDQSSADVIRWKWEFPDGSTSDLSNPEVGLTDLGNKRIIQYVYNQYGCEDSSSVYLGDLIRAKLFIPTAFTPDGDGINDEFKVANIMANSDFTLQVFNRWGELLFETNDFREGWDGTYKGEKVQMDFYLYIYSYRIDNTWHDGGGKLQLLR